LSLLSGFLAEIKGQLTAAILAQRRAKTGQDEGEVTITALYKKIDSHQIAARPNFTKIKETSAITPDSELYVSIQRTTELKYKPGAKKRIKKTDLGELLSEREKEINNLKSTISRLQEKIDTLQKNQTFADVVSLKEKLLAATANKEGDSRHMRAEVKQKLSIISSHPTQSSQRAQTRSSIRQQQLISSFTAEEEEDSNLTDSQLLAHAEKKSMTAKGVKSPTTKSLKGSTAKEAKPDFNRHVGTATAAKKIKTS
jgi:hypothetical protein